MNITIVDYGSGNIQSVKFAIERLGFYATLSRNIREIERSDKVVFPGVGRAGSAVKKLEESKLHTLIPKLEQPVLGICLGMQLMARFSEEDHVLGLNIFDADVVRFSEKLKVPQMGWNTLHHLESPLFYRVPEGAYVYFVHSYYVPVCEHTIATANYGLPYSAALRNKNFYGTQFHPEKSGDIGSTILGNFLNAI